MDGVAVLLADIWSGVVLIWSQFTGLFGSEAFSNVFSALLGAIIGSVSGYWFNQRLEKGRTNERYQIQRKNVIYSPIYKKLLAFEKYLAKQHANKLVLVNVEFKEKEYGYGRNIFQFHIWDEINQDIRKNYLLDAQKTAMGDLIVAVNEHEDLVTQVQTDIEEIVVNFLEKHKSSLKQTAPNIYQPFKSDAINELSALAGVDAYHRTDTLPKDAIRQHIIDGYSLSPQVARQESNAIIRKVASKRSFKALEPSFQNIQKLALEATTVFEKKIHETINKYEGGL